MKPQMTKHNVDYVILWLPDIKLHAIAKENNLPVTAFLVREENKFYIRWITPEYELELCGHGTLAASFVILNLLEPTWNKVDLQSRNELLQVVRNDDDLLTLDFPPKIIESCNLPLLEQALKIKPYATYLHKTERLLEIYDSEEDIRNIKPNIEILKKLEHRGVIITARGSSVDFVSRTFYPQKAICEDIATGASHCLLVPYWSTQLNKNELHAQQLSERVEKYFVSLCV